MAPIGKKFAGCGMSRSTMASPPATTDKAVASGRCVVAGSCRTASVVMVAWSSQTPDPGGEAYPISPCTVRLHKDALQAWRAGSVSDPEFSGRAGMVSDRSSPGRARSVSDRSSRASRERKRQEFSGRLRSRLAIAVDAGVSVTRNRAIRSEPPAAPPQPAGAAPARPALPKAPCVDCAAKPAAATGPAPAG